MAHHHHKAYNLKRVEADEKEEPGKPLMRKLFTPSLLVLIAAISMVAVVFLLPKFESSPNQTQSSVINGRSGRYADLTINSIQNSGISNAIRPGGGRRRTTTTTTTTTTSGPLDEYDEDEDEDIKKFKPIDDGNEGDDDLFASDGTTIMTKYGPIEGFEQQVLNKTVRTFLGVPYAQPPVGPLRFKKTVPLDRKWVGVRQTKTQPPPCAQFRPAQVINTWISQNPNESEDCLFLNIWAPKDTISSEKKTVMVWFHGGAFFSGSIDLDVYQGEILSAYGDVIVVSVAYRLGVFGFLHAGIDKAPGNMGMHDQATALYWIRDNIDRFGGDPKKIVIFGQSAGATSTGLHLFSPMTREIPLRAILQSGSPLFPKNYFQKSMEKSDHFARLAGCSTRAQSIDTDPEAVVDCLMKMDASKLSSLHKDLVKLYKIPFFPHPEDMEYNEFLPFMPHNAIWDEENHGPQQEILIGNNKDEGSFFLHFFIPEVFQQKSAPANLTLEEAKKYIAEAYSFIPENQARVMAEFFLGRLRNDAPSSQILKETYEIIGDSGFQCPANEYAEIMADEFNMTVFNYLFTHRPSNSPWGDWMGVTHLDELQYVFGRPLAQPDQFSQLELDFTRRIMDTWIQFAKTGTVPQQKHLIWPPYSKDEPVYMELNPTIARTEFGPHEKACSIWRVVQQSF